MMKMICRGACDRHNVKALHFSTGVFEKMALFFRKVYTLFMTVLPCAEIQQHISIQNVNRSRRHSDKTPSIYTSTFNQETGMIFIKIVAP